MKIRAVSVIWGKSFVEMFIRVALPSLLAEGNIGDLARNTRLIYTIYTTSEDAAAIQSSKVFSLLNEKVEVRFSLFTSSEIDSTNFGSHNVLWKRGIELAQRNREILFFLIPDVLYCKGTLIRWAALLSEGRKAIYTPGPQVVLETILPELESRISDHCIAIEPQEIASLLLRHLHPMHCGMIRDTHRRIPFAEYDIRTIPGRGIVLRELSAQPFCMDPSYFEKIVNFSPADHLDSVITEPCSVLSLEPLFKRVEWYYRPWRLDGIRLSQLGGWWDYFGPPGCVKDSATAHEFSLNNDRLWRSECAAKIEGGRLFRSQMIASTAIYRLVMKLQNLGLSRSAELLATGLFTAGIRRRIGLRNGGILLIPCNDAFTGAAQEAIENLLLPGQERRLTDVILDHVIPFPEKNSRQIEKTYRNLPLEHLVAGVRVVSGPIMCDSLEIYVIDQILIRDLKNIGFQAFDLPQESTQIVPVLSNPKNSTNLAEPLLSKAHSLFGLSGYPLKSSPSRIKKFLNFALHVPIIEFIVSIPIYFVEGYLRPEYISIHLRMRRLLSIIFNNSPAKAALRPIKRTARLVYSIVEPLPFLGRVARLTRRVYGIARTSGIRVLIKKIILHTRARIKSNIATLVLGVSRRAGRFLTLARRSVAITNSQGIITATHETFFWMSKRYKLLNKLVPGVSRDDLSTFREIRLALGLLAMKDGLQFYAKNTLPSNISFAPLALVNELLSANQLNDSHAHQIIESALQDLLKTHPKWSECWLDLGYLYQDQGRLGDALNCFLRAGTGKQLSSPSGECCDPRSEAYLARARLLMHEGNTTEASQAFAASLAMDPAQSIAHIEYGLALRQLGRVKEAVRCFIAGVPFEETRWCVPKGGRDATKQTFPLLSSNANYSH